MPTSDKRQGLGVRGIVNAPAAHQGESVGRLQSLQWDAATLAFARTLGDVLSRLDGQLCAEENARYWRDREAITERVCQKVAAQLLEAYLQVAGHDRGEDGRNVARKTSDLLKVAKRIKVVLGPSIESHLDGGGVLYSVLWVSNEIGRERGQGDPILSADDGKGFSPTSLADEINQRLADEAHTARRFPYLTDLLAEDLVGLWVGRFLGDPERGLPTIEELMGLADDGEPARLVVPNVFRSDLAPIPTDKPTWALLSAIHDATSGKGWSDEGGQRVPTYKMPDRKGPGAMFVSLRGADGELATPPAVLPSLWSKVRDLDDLVSDVLLACLAYWAWRGQGPNSPVWITANAILDARGVKRIQRRGDPDNWQHGHRREDRIKVGRALALLDNLWLNLVEVEIVPEGRRRKRQSITMETRALPMISKAVQRDMDGASVFMAAKVMPGDWISAYQQADIKQSGLLWQKALGYDRQREKAEKRLAKYLAFHFRWNARAQRGAIRRKVNDLVVNADIEPEQGHPQRAKARLERALDRLREDGVIADWSYVEAGKPLPAKSWLEHWLQTTVDIEPPTALVEHYAQLKAPALAQQGRPRRREGKSQQ